MKVLIDTNILMSAALSNKKAVQLNTIASLLLQKFILYIPRLSNASKSE